MSKFGEALGEIYLVLKNDRDPFWETLTNYGLLCRILLK